MWIMIKRQEGLEANTRGGTKPVLEKRLRCQTQSSENRWCICSSFPRADAETVGFLSGSDEFPGRGHVGSTLGKTKMVGFVLSPVAFWQRVDPITAVLGVSRVAFSTVNIFAWVWTFRGHSGFKTTANAKTFEACAQRGKAHHRYLALY